MPPRFVRFVLVGFFATLVHVAVFAALVEWFGVAAVLAAVAAFLSAMLFSYAANRRWTFAASATHRIQLPKFAVVSLVGLALNVAITYLVVDVLGLWYGYALAAVVTAVPWLSFALNRHWTFNTSTKRVATGTAPQPFLAHLPNRPKKAKPT